MTMELTERKKREIEALADASYEALAALAKQNREKESHAVKTRVK